MFVAQRVARQRQRKSLSASLSVSLSLSVSVSASLSLPAWRIVIVAEILKNRCQRNEPEDSFWWLGRREKRGRELNKLARRVDGWPKVSRLTSLPPSLPPSLSSWEIKFIFAKWIF